MISARLENRLEVNCPLTLNSLNERMVQTLHEDPLIPSGNMSEEENTVEKTILVLHTRSGAIWT